MVNIQVEESLIYSFCIPYYNTNYVTFSSVLSEVSSVSDYYICYSRPSQLLHRHREPPPQVYYAVHLWTWNFLLTFLLTLYVTITPFLTTFVLVFVFTHVIRVVSDEVRRLRDLFHRCTLVVLYIWTFPVNTVDTLMTYKKLRSQIQVTDRVFTTFVE